MSPGPRWLKRPHRRRTLAAAAIIRDALAELVARRAVEVAAGTAPDDLTTRLLTLRDPETGRGLTHREVVDEASVFLVAGHETSASALAWGLYLLAADQDAQARVAAEAALDWGRVGPADLARLPFTRDVLRETLRLYPPVPMMVREAAKPETFRGRAVAAGAQIVLSPWHLHRHTRLWAAPDAFDPDRWASAEGRRSARRAYLPFSAGPRVCPGASFAMVEGVLFLARLVDAFELSPGTTRPVPVAHLTVRSRDGIRLRLTPRSR